MAWFELVTAAMVVPVTTGEATASEVLYSEIGFALVMLKAPIAPYEDD